jgi:hypothetical protein
MDKSATPIKITANAPIKIVDKLGKQEHIDAKSCHIFGQQCVREKFSQFAW